MHTLYQMPGSGNCYKLRLAMTQLGVLFETVDLDVRQGKSHTEAFLAMNPDGKVPLLRLPEGICLPESNAGLCYLAEDSSYLPASRLSRARVLQWMFFEQNSLEPYLANSRFWRQLSGCAHKYRKQILRAHGKGVQSLSVMEQHLSERDFFVDDRYSIADMALYAHTHLAEEGGFSLQAFPAVRRWLRRVASQPGYIGIDENGSALHTVFPAFSQPFVLNKEESYAR